ncbi:MAG: TspO/MBR family protein [Flavobacteriia bacterium]|jgi:benzodiazapine receptor
MRLILILILNFGALVLGALLMNGSPASNEWYSELNKAPWTPPGWMFGIAWTVIMITYAFYMDRVIAMVDRDFLPKIYILYALQWVLNVIWNPVFFAWHLPILGAIVIFLLIVVLVSVNIYYSTRNTVNLILLTPYVLWLSVAFSMNLYIVIMN